MPESPGRWRQQTPAVAETTAAESSGDEQVRAEPPGPGCGAARSSSARPSASSARIRSTAWMPAAAREHPGDAQQGSDEHIDDPAWPPGTSRKISSLSGATLETVSETRGPSAPATAPMALPRRTSRPGWSAAGARPGPANDAAPGAGPFPAVALGQQARAHVPPPPDHAATAPRASAASSRTSSAARSGLVNGRAVGPSRWARGARARPA